MEKQEDFNKGALRKLTEQYLTAMILEQDILGFLVNNVKTKKSRSTELAEKAGKSLNTIYKNINELSIYNAISLLRYWQAMIDICKEYKIENSRIPSLDQLLLTYKDILTLLNHITTEDQIEILIQNNLNALSQIVIFYKNKSTTEKEKELLKQLLSNSLINSELKNQQQQQKVAQLERMKRK
ncbi:hypothetical protein ACIQXQ_11405 [Peribacillus sp. NPDC097198]|uniref:hypothetical protein n=1 Tax=Peribacillus sp. NPDC097198 TaxID=3364397 RepID=UPI0037FCD11E